MAAHILQLTATIKKYNRTLTDTIDINHGLMDIIRATGVLKKNQIDIIVSIRGRIKQVQTLLEYVEQMTLKQQKQFMTALYDTDQGHVNNFIWCNGRRQLAKDCMNWPLIDLATDEFDKIDRNLLILKDALDTENGLLGEMLSVGCINSRHKEDIEGGNTRSEKNERLLNILQLRSIGDFRNFIFCLEQTKQHRVASILRERLQGTHEARKFIDEFNCRLQTNHATLVALIDSRTKLLDELFGCSCITTQQIDHIKRAESEQESNTRLLNILKGFDEENIEKFMQCLRRTEQHHICTILHDGRIAIRMEARITEGRTLLYRSSNGSNISAMNSGLIADQFTALLHHSPHELLISSHRWIIDEVNKLWNSEVHLIAIRSQNANIIELHFLCQSLPSLFYLHESYSSGDLEAILRRMFTILNDNRSVNIDSLLLDYSTYNACAQHLCGLNGLKYFQEMYHFYQFLPCTDRGSPECSVLRRFQDLPFELVENFVIKAAGQLITKFHVLIPEAAHCSMVTLCAVSKQWRKVLFNRRFIKRSLKMHYRRICKPFFCNPRHLQNLHIEGGSEVRGIAELNGALYVVCCECGCIKVFDSRQPFNWRTNIEVPGLKDPVDIVASAETGHIYIADYDTCIIWRVFSTSYKQVDSFITTPSQPMSLSTKFRRLTVILQDDAALFMYGDDGVLLKHIKLPDDLLAIHAVETCFHTFIVSYWSKWSDHSDDMNPKDNNVSEIDMNGQIIRTFNSQYTDIDYLKFGDPERLALADDSYVFVADCAKARIALLNDCLQLQRVLLKSLGIQPTGMCFVHKNGLLFVACSQAKTSNIEIYKVMNL
jgi:hypothetical protein